MVSEDLKIPVSEDHKIPLICRFILISFGAGLQIYSDQFGWFADLFWPVWLICRFILISFGAGLQIYSDQFGVGHGWLALAIDDWRWPLMIGVGHGWLAVICRFCFAQMEFYINPRRALFVAWSCVPLCDGVRCIKMAPMPWAVDLVRFNGRKVKEFEMQFGGWRLEKEHCRVADWFWPTVWHALYVCVEGFWSWKRIWDKGRWGDDELRQCLRDGTKGKGTKFLCCRLNEFEWKRAVRRGRNGELLRQSPFAIILTTWECMGHSEFLCERWRIALNG